MGALERGGEESMAVGGRKGKKMEGKEKKEKGNERGGKIGGWWQGIWVVFGI